MKNPYKKLKISLPTLNGVMVEKFIAPSVSLQPDLGNWVELYWFDKYGCPHSFNGMPAWIVIMPDGKQYRLNWYKHGEKIKESILTIEEETKEISNKIKLRNFQERAKKKPKKKR